MDIGMIDGMQYTILTEVEERGARYAMASYAVSAPSGAKRTGMQVLRRRSDAPEDDPWPWEVEPDLGIRADVWEVVKRQFVRHPAP
jgi:hypothetical protein